MAFRHVITHFGSWPVAKVEHADVAEWVTVLGESEGPGTLRGHDSITTTARIYTLLYDDELDEIAAALDSLRGPRS